MKNFELDVLVDGQFGSTGKGLAAQYLAGTKYYDIHFTNAGAQSGHTSIRGDRKIVAYHLSTAGIHQKLNGGQGLQYVCAGAIIDPLVLKDEIKLAGYKPNDVKVHWNAAVIEEKDRKAEAKGDVAKIASTGKGVGSALARKILRQGNTIGKYTETHGIGAVPTKLDPMDMIIRHGLKTGILEIPQGMSLGINSGFYPHCTSRECTVMQGLADLRIHPDHLGYTTMVIRTFPIRVGNTDKGNSGGWYPDQQEISWDWLDQEPEITTVTGRVRRVATFSFQQYREALIVNRPHMVFVNFMNYFKTDMDQFMFVAGLRKVHDDLGKWPKLVFGYGPKLEDIRESFD